MKYVNGLLHIPFLGYGYLDNIVGGKLVVTCADESLCMFDGWVVREWIEDGVAWLAAEYYSPRTLADKGKFSIFMKDVDGEQVVHDVVIDRGESSILG